MKNELDKWRKEIEEISNNVYKEVWTHELGTSIEKTGHNLEQMESEMKQSAIEMNKSLEQIIKRHNKG